MNTELKTLRRLEPSRNPPEGPSLEEQEAAREACTCTYGLDLSGNPVRLTCPLHTPPEPEGV